MEAIRSALRTLPQVQKVMEEPGAQALTESFGRAAVLACLRAELDQVRESLKAGGGAASPPPSALLEAVARTLQRDRMRTLRRTINATGIVIHTNLGRAPLAREAVEAVAEIAETYSNLEIDLESGRRGSRYHVVDDLLCAMTGAEAALVVNNNAAAVLLALSALAAGGEAVVSRGELVEIGGSFRIPDIVRQGGARLVGVGTTNRTRLSDYESAIGPDTRVILKVHPSNYRVVGFTEMPDRATLVALARRHGLPVLEDLGSGMLMDLPLFDAAHEPTVRESLKAGVDLVTFSGDKLLGGPQAGILLGRRDLIGRLKTHPLLRALRVDKLTLAALEATLRLHRNPDRAREAIPVLRMLTEDDATLARRAERLCARLSGIEGLSVERLEGSAQAGGGSLPGTEIPSRVVAVRAATITVEDLAQRLRQHRPAIVGRLSGSRMLLDMRTLRDEDLPDIEAGLRSALA